MAQNSLDTRGKVFIIEYQVAFEPCCVYIVRLLQFMAYRVILCLSERCFFFPAGNIGNKFSIDLHTGELTARPLDRESHSRYWLVITAQDRGSPVSLQGSCNVSVIVEDQNDNDPRFSQPRYSATIRENVLVDTVVLTVQATDADLGVNARIVYSLANESQWLFRIDNRSGVITTAG